MSKFSVFQAASESELGTLTSSSTTITYVAKLTEMNGVKRGASRFIQLFNPKV